MKLWTCFFDKVPIESSGQRPFAVVFEMFLYSAVWEYDVIRKMGAPEQLNEIFGIVYRVQFWFGEDVR